MSGGGKRAGNGKGTAKPRTSGKTWKVADILEMRWVEKGGLAVAEYLVHWQGCAAKHNSWEPADNITAAALDYFHNIDGAGESDWWCSAPGGGPHNHAA